MIESLEIRKVTNNPRHANVSILFVCSRFPSFSMANLFLFGCSHSLNALYPFCI